MGEARDADLGALRRHSKIVWLALIAAVGGAVSIPVGCGLDDTAINAIDGADGSSVDGSGPVGDGGPIGDSSGDAVTCTPETCANYPSNCKSGLSNGCGSTLDCTHACPGGQACIAASGTCDGPPVCADAGAPGGNCGEIVNPGNGLDASCGTCANPGYACVSSTCSCSGTVCGANCCNGGTPNCNSTNNTCCLKNTTCVADTCNPTNADNCGGNLDCSANCNGGKQCGTDKVCALPPTCTNKGNPGGSCGIVAGTHGLTVDCGTCGGGSACSGNTCSCTSGKFCNVTCCAASSNVCDLSSNCCAPDSMATTCAGKCGTVTNNCGQPVVCGACSTNDICGGGACDCSGNACAAGDKCCFSAGNHFCHAGGVCN